MNFAYSSKISGYRRDGYRRDSHILYIHICAILKYEVYLYKDVLHMQCIQWLSIKYKIVVLQKLNS